MRSLKCMIGIWRWKSTWGGNGILWGWMSSGQTEFAQNICVEEGCKRTGFEYDEMGCDKTSESDWYVWTEGRQTGGCCGTEAWKKVDTCSNKDEGTKKRILMRMKRMIILKNIRCIESIKNMYRRMRSLWIGDW